LSIFLHVGCGPARKRNTTPGFRGDNWDELRLDIDPAVKPDIVGSLTDMSAVDDESVDAIYSSHNIEHLYSHEVPVALREFLRVLKPDGFAVVTCPNLQSIGQLIADGKLTEPVYHSPAGPIAPIDMIYGYRKFVASGNPYMAHHCGFTRKVLMASLKQAGFEKVAGLAEPMNINLWVIGTKRQVEDERLRELAAQHFPASSTRRAAS
jgi:SAM-dependent methyltransferase